MKLPQTAHSFNYAAVKTLSRDLDRNSDDSLKLETHLLCVRILNCTEERILCILCDKRKEQSVPSERMTLTETVSGWLDN